MVAIILLALAASVYLVYVLEIFKFKRLRARDLRTADRGTSDPAVDQMVPGDAETGDRVGTR